MSVNNSSCTINVKRYASFHIFLDGEGLSRRNELNIETEHSY